MPDEPPKRVILEKSRTLRRRYQRSNKQFRFTASQIARIEREQERENRAQQLRDREKKRVANKKKKAEKEALAREARRKLGKLGLPDPNAPKLPASQPLLFNFIKKGKEEEEESVVDEGGGGDTEVDESTTEVWEGDLEGLDSGSGFGEEDFDLELLMTESEDEDEDEGDGDGDGDGDEGRDAGESTACDRADKVEDKDEDEFSDCSIFYDEDIIKEADPIVTAPDEKHQPAPAPAPPTEAPARWAAESFQDDTALLLEEFGNEFDTDEEFEQALVELDAVSPRGMTSAPELEAGDTAQTKAHPIILRHPSVSQSSASASVS
ncbi:hypothetical protein BO71DRAFT_436396 [Aspergillus ellipticus CBS 707.79]|uniref:Uncharacterized protein n=1 Tax=Aspergillus ellipticus CBS 707.79 TaxID=1448320 RepID=A0A319CQZ7_9EURO|nr:hypothetical protein BO71DRAFT_436396 [Aspergillus ellipticus CBS 707.79]